MPALVYRRRVQFADTDMAGIVHFSMFFRYMEEAEHGLWREAGLSLADAPSSMGFPRVAATCDYRSPLRFEDEFDIAIRVTKLGPRSLAYACEMTRAETLIATGTMTCVAAAPGPTGMRSVSLPSTVVERLRPYL